MPVEPGVPTEYYNQFYTYCPALTQFVDSTLTRGLYPHEYLQANLNRLKKLAKLGREYGLKPGLLCFEPRTLPEHFFERYPTLRGARVDGLVTNRDFLVNVLEHPAFLDGLVEKGHTALELPFVKDFPWKERQCRAFGQLAFLHLSRADKLAQAVNRGRREFLAQFPSLATPEMQEAIATPSDVRSFDQCRLLDSERDAENGLRQGENLPAGMQWDDGETLPAEPDNRALSGFLELRRKADPEHFADLSLSIIKLLGAGAYVVEPAAGSGTDAGHFGLAVADSSTAELGAPRVETWIDDRRLETLAAECRDAGSACLNFEGDVREGKWDVTPAIFFTSAGMLAGPGLGLIDLRIGSEPVKLLAEATLTLVLFADFVDHTNVAGEEHYGGAWVDLVFDVSDPFVSVLVPVRNEERYLERTVRGAFRLAD